MTEKQEQEALFEWAKYRPDLKLMHHVVNEGRRSIQHTMSLIRQGMMTDEGLVKVLSEFSIGCLSKLVVQGEIPQPKSGWAKVKEDIRTMQLKIVKTERK